MIVIAYDGSDDARAAIGQAATLMPGHPALVLSVWEPAFQMLTALADAGGVRRPGDRDPSSSRDMERCAAEGARLAQEAGIDCTARTRARTGTVAATILGEAEDVGATAIIVGRRGPDTPGTSRLGSTARAVVDHARCAVLVASAVPARAWRPREDPADTGVAA